MNRVSIIPSRKNSTASINKHCTSDAQAILDALGLEVSTRFQFTDKKSHGPKTQGQWMDRYEVTVKAPGSGREPMSIPFWCGTGHRMLKGDPDSVMATVLAPPLNPMTVVEALHSDLLRGAAFEDWAEDLGYDTDSRHALDVYMACQKQEASINRLCPGFAEKCEAWDEFRTRCLGWDTVADEAAAAASRTVDGHGPEAG
jgi:hypothetical protein